ncbi:MAG: ATP-dependent DNA helicase, partial [Mycobacteriales bacterium]
AGVTAELLKAWSKRSADIEAEAAPKITQYETVLGRKLTAAERAPVTKTAVLKTRPAKRVEDAVSLHGRWHGEAEALGWSPGRLLAAVRDAARRTSAEPATATALPREALVAAGRRRAAFSRADLAGQVAARLPTAAATAEEVRRSVEELADAALGLPEAVSLGEVADGLTRRRSDHRYATAELLAAEARVLTAAGAGRTAGLAQVDQVNSVYLLTAATLDADQQAALTRLTTSGAFLEVLTAPAGAGKTATVGAAARLWRHQGIRVLALAPTARAAADLAAATCSPADTLAKWAYEHDQGRGWLTANTVVVVDEASRADTFTLEALVSAAREAGAKLVLLGDPAQPGVIDGAGGLLALLAQHGHGVALTGVRRFHHLWERDASLALRAGDPAALTTYAGHHRIHPAAGRTPALDAVFTHWAQAVTTGADTLMLTRSRADAEALNARARTAAITAGTITGPAVNLGGRCWQAGDLLRARRNDRRIPLGATHLRNGDRFRVHAVTPGGLLVDELSGRGRVLLPAGYLACHVDYGWATTIDTAQGSTADVGILLAHPGLDREHLYVGLTRGRQANHVHVDTTPADAETHHLPSRHNSDLTEAIQALTRVLARVGAEPAAHTAAARATRHSEHDPVGALAPKPTPAQWRGHGCTGSEPGEQSVPSTNELLRRLHADADRIASWLHRRQGYLSSPRLGYEPYLHADHHRDGGRSMGR